jgi:alkylation response protein AidB-like acyl-CoA dehydrogenase
VELQVNLTFSDEDVAFREQVRAWLGAHAPREARPHEPRAARTFDLSWQRALWEGGWAGIDWPKAYGGREASLTQQLIWYEEYGRLGLPPVTTTFVGLSHAGPTLILEGTEQQRREHLPRILAGDVVWCQGFSEPGAGSDLAAIATRGVVDGDELVISGQKIWTSFADVADWQELLVRTDPSASRHRGLSWVICDMHSPGIEVRPIATMNGGQEFCEVFYDEVRVPLANVVGGLHEGWRVAMSTLSFERGTAFTLSQVQLAKVVDDLVDEARRRPGPDGRRSAMADDELAHRIATVRAEVMALRSLTYQTVSETRHRGSPGAAGSIVKLYYSELLQQVHRIALDVIGPEALHLVPWWEGGWSGGYLHSFGITIGGGTSEIQRNIIGERVLGLPR